MLEKVFQRHLARTVNEEVLRVRLTKAQELLAATTNLTVAEVALATGFTRPSHFYRTYKKHFGTTPKTPLKVPAE